MSAALTQSLRTLLRRKGSGSYGHIQKLEGVPFYEARPPWWAKFTWGFIAADLVVTCVNDLPIPPPVLFLHLSVSPQLDDDGADVDEVDAAVFQARRRARVAASMATRGAQLGSPLARRGLRDVAADCALTRSTYLAYPAGLGQRAEAALDRGRTPTWRARRGGAVLAHAHRPRTRRVGGHIAYTGRAGALVGRAHACAATRRLCAYCALAGRVHGGMGDPEEGTGR
jgi:hypothetical protein